MGGAYEADSLPREERAKLERLVIELQRMDVSTIEIIGYMRQYRQSRGLSALPLGDLVHIIGTAGNKPVQAPAARTEAKQALPATDSPPVSSASSSGNAALEGVGSVDGLDSVSLSGIQAEVVTWLWPGRIPMGKLTVLRGELGIGKSCLAVDIAARVSRGAAWPDGQVSVMPEGKVLLLSGDDGLSDMVRPRLEGGGANLENVAAIKGVHGVSLNGTTADRRFELGRDLSRLRRSLESGDVRLVIIDPLEAYCGQIDSCGRARAWRLLAPLAALAAEYGIAVLLVVCGKMSYIAARNVWEVIHDPLDPTLRLFMPVTVHCGSVPTGLAFRVTEKSIAWEEGPVTAERFSGKRANQRRIAVDWLKELLQAGPYPATDVMCAGEAKGLSPAQITRAKFALGIQPRKESGRGGRWIWELPWEGESSMGRVASEALRSAVCEEG